MASSSSSSSSFANPQKYDVFISFRGADTRHTFTSHLYAALVRKKIETYMDHKLERGDEIGPSLLQAIKKSKLSLIVFSKNYAFSTWCLDELVHILGCKKSYGQIVIPIFYDTDPSQVRKQHGSYGDAFAELEERFKDNMDKVLMWRNASKEAASMSGFDNSNRTGTDADFIEEVVEDVLTKLNQSLSSDLEDLDQFYSRNIEEIKSLLCLDSPDVCTVGIWVGRRVGSLGKSWLTTLSDGLIRRLSRQFEATCFLANVKERSKGHGLNDLRNLLLCEILNEKDLSIDTASVSPFIQERLSRTKALIVLDDVNDLREIKYLACTSQLKFGPGSRIIITTRDRSLLKKTLPHDKIYKFGHMEGLMSWALNSVSVRDNDCLIKQGLHGWARWVT
ncbi:TMV resistance protein N-like [Prunus avium]|uniref:TMV resistance protein N-like n=1 Tax=Prunus avium TaxID=42229 RepID=A0A6P5U3H6_PRUAV|nr:TMV resistance protein N-like [Prunus avium]